MRLLPSQPQPRLRKGEKSQLEKELMDLDRKEVDCWDSSLRHLTYGFIMIHLVCFCSYHQQCALASLATTKTLGNSFNSPYPVAT